MKLFAALLADYPVTDDAAKKKLDKNTSKVLDDIAYVEMREMILAKDTRLDGRNTKSIRPIACEVGLSPCTHGSALFTRGETQSLTTLTLGTKPDEQTLEGLRPETTKRFMLHYNFPPYSVGEVGRFGTPGRREVGHGNLAERALKRVAHRRKPYSPILIRIVSDIPRIERLSSSMATVCAGSLALFDGMGCRCRSTRCRHRYGACEGRRSRRRPERHSRRRRPSGRYRLQGRGHAAKASPRSKWILKSAVFPWKSLNPL